MRKEAKIYFEYTVNFEKKEMSDPLLRIPGDLSNKEKAVLEVIFGKKICLQPKKEKKKITGTTDLKTD